MKESRHILRVMKFGGSSVANADCIGGVAELLVRLQRKQKLAVVVSALGGITDTLIQAAQHAARGKTSLWRMAKQEIERRHFLVAEKLLPPRERPQVELRLSAGLANFEALCSGVTLMREITPRALDALSSLGELMSAALLAGVLRSRGVAAQAVDGADLLVTDEGFGNASPIFDLSRAKTRKRLLPLLQGGVLPVITGYRGATRKGVCTTLGRGGSDYSATLIGAALDAREVWIWTDVDGVMTADPRLVPKARIVPSLSYREAVELSFFGAKVLYYKTLQPVIKKRVPVWIKNTFNPAARGTRISLRSSSRSNPSGGIKAITSVARADLVTLSGGEIFSFPAMAARAFEALASQSISTLIVTQSSADNVLCFAIHHGDLDRVRAVLRKTFELEMLHDYMGPIEVMRQAAIVVAIGENMEGTPGIAGRAFGALGKRGINVIAIAQGSSELSISFAVKTADVKGAVGALHREFKL